MWLSMRQGNQKKIKIKVLIYVLPIQRLICCYGDCKWQQWRRVNVDSRWRRLLVIDLFPKLADLCRWRIVLDLCAPPFRPILLSSVKNMIACSLFSICQNGFQLFKILHYSNPQSSFWRRQNYFLLSWMTL